LFQVFLASTFQTAYRPRIIYYGGGKIVLKNNIDLIN